MTENAPDDTIKSLKDRTAGDVLTADDIRAIKKITKVYLGLAALGWLGVSLRNILVVVASIVGAYGVVTGQLVRWAKLLSGAE